MRVYGYDWPDDIGAGLANADINIHLWCYANWDPFNKHMLQRHEHMILAMKLLFPEELPNGERGLTWNEWTEWRIWSLCYRPFQTWWGSTSCGKSHDSAAFFLADWLAAPHKTTTQLCSESKDMLTGRIWRDMVRLHSSYDKTCPLPGERFKDSIIYRGGDGESTINKIECVAVQRGKVEQGVAHLSGIHNERNRLVIDEMQATPEAAVEAWDNLATADHLFLGMGNPVSRMDALGRYSEPVDGWNSISVEDTEWRTAKGMCLHFDGLKSPGIRNPRKFWFMITQSQVDNMMVYPGPDSPRFWTQIRGFLAPEDASDTVLTEAFAQKFNMTECATWEDTYTWVFGLDPAFSTGGNDVAWRPAKVGKMTNGQMGIELQKEKHLLVKATGNEPITFGIAKQVIAELDKYGLDVDSVAMDSTTSQTGLADIIDSMSRRGKRVYRVDFAGAASDLPVGEDDTRPCNEKYKDRVTELWYTMTEFGRYDQIRGLSGAALKQFCTRRLDKRLDSKRLLRVESKREMKKRTAGQSPDDADACVCVLDFARNKMGIHPGGAKARRKRKTEDIETLEGVEYYREYDGEPVYGDGYRHEPV